MLMEIHNVPSLEINLLRKKIPSSLFLWSTCVSLWSSASFLVLQHNSSRKSVISSWSELRMSCSVDLNQPGSASSAHQLQLLHEPKHFCRCVCVWVWLSLQSTHKAQNHKCAHIHTERKITRDNGGMPEFLREMNRLVWRRLVEFFTWKTAGMGKLFSR